MPIGAAIGGAVATAGGGILAANAQKKAANKAADTSLQAAQENNALYREIYGQNKALLTPYSNQGLQAGNALNDLLLGTSTYNPNATAPAPAGGSGPGTGSPSGYSGPALGAIGSQGQMDAYLNYYRAHPEEDPGFTSISPFHGDPYKDEAAAQGVLAARNAWLAAHPNGVPPPATPPATTPPAGTGTGTSTTPGNALDAFARFRQGTNYQWRLGQGQSALESGLAAHGSLESGAADKAIVQYGQNFASNELSNYMNLLAGQQGVGLSAASAIAGVGNTYAGGVAAQNTNAANTAANAALSNGTANANMWGSIASGVGQLGGALYQYKPGGY